VLTALSNKYKNKSYLFRKFASERPEVVTRKGRYQYDTWAIITFGVDRRGGVAW